MSKHRYKIQYYFELGGCWMTSFPFCEMQKSFAEGAWAMLKAHYNQQRIHRLVRQTDEFVVDTCGRQEVQVN